MKTAAIQEIIPRILRDMSDGVLVLDMQGNILYLNEQGQTLLGVEKDCTGLKYTAAFGSRTRMGKTMPSISLCWTPSMTRNTHTAVRRPTLRMAVKCAASA